MGENTMKTVTEKEAKKVFETLEKKIVGVKLYYEGGTTLFMPITVFKSLLKKTR